MKYLFILIQFAYSNFIFSQAEILPLKITFNDSIGSELNNDATPIDVIEYYKLGFNLIENYSENFKYSFITLENYLNYKIIVLQRDYSEENIHWICILKDNILLDKIKSFYDNSEGFINITSIISNAEIKINEWNMYSESQGSVHYYLMTNNGIEKIKK